LILFNVTGGPNLTLFEVNQAAAIIKETAHPDVNLIFGAVIDPKIGDEIRITVIATGFDSNGVRPNERPIKLEELQTPLRSRQTMTPTQTSSHTSSIPAQQPAQQVQPEFQRVVNTDDFDIPAFLRNRKR
jgi:cell division protein FtsZ